MKRKTILFWVFTTFIILLFVNSLFGGTARKRYHKRVDFNKGGILYLTNTNGTIKIRSWNKNEVDIRAEIKVTARSNSEARDFLDEVEIVIDERGGRLEIEADYPNFRRGRRNSFWDIVKSVRRPSVSISYTITVPEEIDLDIETTNGSVNISQIEGEIEARTTNGNITTENINGSVTAKTTNGSISAELESVRGNDDMEFTSTNGSIKVYIPSNYGADIDARTTNGRVYSDFRLDRSRRSSKKSLRGQINGGGGYLKLHTTNGSIYIREY